MNRTLLQVQLMYNNMGKAEKRVADYLLSHSGEILPYSISELAEKCDSSEATIVRFSRRLGYGGYQDLKIVLAQELDKKVISPTISAEDSCYEMFEKACNDAYLSLERTMKTLSESEMTRAANVIGHARKTVLIGLGSSAAVAADASNKFLRAGCNSVSYSDTHMQTIAVSQLGAPDVVIGISQSGMSKDIVDALKIAKSRGATTICVTSKDKSPLTRQSDIVLLTDTEETRHSSLGLNSHIARLIVIDALCYKIVYETAGKAFSIGEGEAGLMSKRIVE